MVLVDRKLAQKELGEWAIGFNLFKRICEILPIHSSILELGSGLGTKHLSKRYIMHSVETDVNYLFKYNSYYFHCKLDPNTGWFDRKVLEPAISKINYDLLLVDAPVGSRGRKGYLDNMDIFKSGKFIVIDDTNREFENLAAIHYEKAGYKVERIKETNKESAIITL